MAQKPYPYQERVAQYLLQGKSVILQAPTGAGKTRAALWPFLHAQREEVDVAFPAQCIYTVPMRVLASQFYQEYRDVAHSFSRRFKQPISVHIQTGETPDDPELTGDLIFATLDQTLSSLLGVPYSLSLGRANFNVGAVLGSYLIFDEFHLFPREATKTTLQLLRTVEKIAPFILMTATFSKTMLNEIGRLLNAEVITLPEHEIIAIETREGHCLRKERTYSVKETTLKENIPFVLDTHKNRSLVVCNTVDRAIEVYDSLLTQGCVPIQFDEMVPSDVYEKIRIAKSTQERQKYIEMALQTLLQSMTGCQDKKWVMLLHSRFERSHRQVKEALLQFLWNPKGLGAELSHSLIVVGTQVVEVGLDISAEILHTEIAPASSIFQRAGRCARYAGQQGIVYVYSVPPKKNGEPNYAPYGMDKIEKDVCERSWRAFVSRNEKILRFEDEQAIIDEAHTEADQSLLQAMNEDSSAIWSRIADALTGHDPSARSDLIRKNFSSRTVIVYDAPNPRVRTDENPYSVEGFSLHVGSLSKLLPELNELQTKVFDFSDDMGWTLRAVKPIPNKDDDEPTAYEWYNIQTEEDLKGTLILAVHPRLVSYDAGHGLRLAVPGDGNYRSKKIVRRRQLPDFGSYQLESYDHHIQRMCEIFEQGPWLRRLNWIAHRLEQRQDAWHIPAGMLERAVRLAFALHDLGKLDERWQTWAHAYQREIGEPCPPNMLIAHTHYDKNNPIHEEAQKRLKSRKPSTHAGEGADAGAKILWEALNGKNQLLYQAAFTAIARHHSPTLTGQNVSVYTLSQSLMTAMPEILKSAGITDNALLAQLLRFSSQGQSPDLQKRLLKIPPEIDYLWWWLYFVIVRNLRYCDGRSQEEGMQA